MQVQFVLNGSVALILSPDNEAEEALIKQLLKQDNDMVQIRNAVHVLSKNYPNGVIIGIKGKYARDMSQDDTETKDL
jgi:hypothetical protein